MGIFGFFKPKACEVCGYSKPEQYIVEGKKTVYICRNDLFKQFKKDFLAYPHNMVVCYPELSKYYDSMYPYQPIATMKSFNFPEEAIEVIRTLIRSDLGTCLECTSIARCVYFDQSVMSGIKSSTGFLLEKLPGKPSENLCKEHAFKKIYSQLVNNPTRYGPDWGIFAPYGGEGVYVSTPL